MADPRRRSSERGGAERPAQPLPEAKPRQKRRKSGSPRYENVGERVPGKPRAYTGASGRKRSVVPGYDSERDVTRTTRAGENMFSMVLLCAALGAAAGGGAFGGAGGAAGAGAAIGAAIGLVFYLILMRLMKGGPMGS